MCFRKFLFFVLLFSSCFCFSSTGTISSEDVTRITTQLNYIGNNLASIRYNNERLIDNYGDNNYSSLIKTYLTSAEGSLASVRQYLNYIDFSSATNSVSGGSCSWSTNDVQSVIDGLMSLASNVATLNNALFFDGDSLMDLVSQIYTEQYLTKSLVSTSSSDITDIKTYLQSYFGSSGFSYFINILHRDINNLEDTLSSVSEGLYDGFEEILIDSMLPVIEDIYNVVEADTSSFATIIDFLGSIAYDVGNISTNTAYIVQALNGMTNRFYHSSLMGYDRFRYFGKPMTGSEVQLSNLSPFDSLANLQNATIYDVLASGFSSSLISFGSINNYLHYLEQAVVSNNDSRIVAHLGAISNLVNRVDDYVLNDFSNEFHTLAVEIDSWYQGGVSNQNQVAISNQLYLSVITQQLDNVSGLLQTNNFLLSDLLVITNDLGLISTNLSWVVDNIRDLELPVTSEFRGDQDNYYEFLTNYYLVGTAGDNPSSNWFERVEVLLAALVFSGNSTTNMSDTLSDSSSLSQQVETLVDSINFSEDVSNSLGLSRNVQQSYIGFFHSLRNIVSSKSQNSTFVFGWGDKDTLTFEDLVDGKFRISISANEGKFGTFTAMARAVTSMIWVLFTLFCVYKMGFWLCAKIYSVYSVVRSLIFSLWGK